MEDTTQAKRFLTPNDVEAMANSIVSQIPRRFQHVYGIPRGGVPAAMAVAAAYRKAGGSMLHVSTTEFDCSVQNTLIVDDIYDSGKTLAPWILRGYACAVLVARGRFAERIPNGLVVGEPIGPGWIVFPWEGNETGPEDAVRRLLQYLGEDPDAPHLQETPRRFLSWLNEFRAGQEPDFHATKFETCYSGMVVVRGIPFTSLCAHHLLPFSGRATVAYVPPIRKEPPQPTAVVLGLSKLARIVQHHAKRLQSQEEMTRQVLDAVKEASGTVDVAVTLSAEHSCMNFRGPRVPGAETITSELSGAFWTQPEARAEFMSFVHPSA